jgi:8-oxo-dGTP diphosphatase
VSEVTTPAAASPPLTTATAAEPPRSARWRLGQFVLFDVGALPYALLTSQPTWRAHGGELARLAGVTSGQRVLDVGCGPGESAFGMAERIPGLQVTGLDYSPTMVRLARLRRRFDRAARDVALTRGDAMDLPFPDGHFDAVTGHSFLYLVPDAHRVLTEARRVLRPGRRCVFLEPAAVADRPLLPPAIRERALRDPRFVSSMALWRIVSRRYGRFDEARLRETFESAGLEPVEARPTLEGLGFFGVARRPLLASNADVDWERWRPTDTATLLFVVEADRVLLIRKKRGLGAGKVNAPGGRIERGESAASCAVREVQEELCVTPTGVEPMGELRFQFQDGYGLHCHLFRASGCIGEPKETDEAVPLWTPKNAIPFSEMWADDALWLPLLLAGRRGLRGRFVFDGDRMLDHDLAADG